MTDARSGSAGGNAGAREPNVWQPIETAPKDGSQILMFAQPVSAPDGRFGIGCFIEWRGEGMLWDWTWGFQPTHWMPLPAPPLARAEAVPPSQPIARQLK